LEEVLVPKGERHLAAAEKETVIVKDTANGTDMKADRFLFTESFRYGDLLAVGS